MSADTIFSLANWVLVAALVLGVLATFAIVVSGKNRDDALKQELVAQSTRAAELSMQTESLKLSIAVAEYQAADVESAHDI